VVESPSTWDWLVDGVMAAGSPVPLANPAAMQPYDGLKDPNDPAEARWLAPLFRLGVVPAGTRSPKAERAVRAVLRQRSPLGAPHPSHGLSGPNLLARHTGGRFGVKQIYKLSETALTDVLPEAAQVLAVSRRRVLLECLRHQRTTLAKAVRQPLQPPPASEQRWRVTGSGALLAQRLRLETGASGRLATVGTAAAAGRGGSSTTSRTGKRTGPGPGKNGPPSLAWASLEAAPFAIRCRPPGQRFAHRQAAKSPLRSARTSVAHTLARAGVSVLRALVPCAVHKALGCG
jgi:transposase